MKAAFTSEQQKIIARLRAAGQQHVLRWLDDLTDQQRAAFLAQLAQVDFDRVQEFAQPIGDTRGTTSAAALSTQHLDAVAEPRAGSGTRPTTPVVGPVPSPGETTPGFCNSLSALSTGRPPSRGTPAQVLQNIAPAPVDRLPRTDAERRADAKVVALGRKALEADRAAALTVAGGQGTRLGYDGPKGTFPITPVRQKTLFQVLAEKVLAARRRYGCRMPWLIMTSPTNDETTRAFFAQHDHFGLGADTIHFFPQNVNPILGRNGRLLLDDKGALLVGPDGHGGVFAALAASGLADRLAAAGHDLISYFQVDNPLVTVADERFIGHHLRREADLSCKVVPKRDAAEGLGVAVLAEGRPSIVEYIDLPKQLAEECTAAGELKFLFGSIAVHIIGTEFAREMGTRKGALRWHIARKNYASLNDQGEKAPGECYKFEQFVFDCLPHAKGCAFVEVERESEFAPVKNAQGADSAQTCREMMKALWLRWLREAGADCRALEAPDAQVEISPLYAASAEELKAKLPRHFSSIPPVVLNE